MPQHIQVTFCEGEGVKGIGDSQLAGLFSALQIFHTQNHPSVFKVDAKEGLSLYSVLDRTKTKAGSSLLRSWLRLPTRDVATLTERQDAVAFFAHPAHRDLADSLAAALAGSGNILVTPPMIPTSVAHYLCIANALLWQHALTNLQRGRTTIRQWQRVLKVRVGNLFVCAYSYT